MIIRLIILLAFIAVPCFAADTYYPTPSHSQIKSWWKAEHGARPDEGWGIRDIKPIRLKSGEQAFVASALFPTRGHCCEAGVLLIRPALQEARQIDSADIDLNPMVSELIDLNGGRVTGVVVLGLMTSAGETAGHNTFVYFDEWNPVILHARRFGGNLYSCGGGDILPSCHGEEVKWVFMDLDGDNITDLIEPIVTKDGREPDHLTWKTKLNAYLIKDKKVVPLSPGLMESDFTESQGKAKSDTNCPADKQGHRSPNINTPEEEQPVDNEVFISKCRSGLDQAVTTARDILSQFGLTAAESGARGVAKPYGTSQHK